MRSFMVVVLGVGLACAACGTAGKKAAMDQDGTLDGVTGDADSASPDTALPELPEAGRGDGEPADTVAPDSAVPDATAETAGDAVTPPDVPAEAAADATPPVPDVSLPDLSREGESCYDMVQCGIAFGCAPSDATCWEKCKGDASDMALWKFDGVISCVVQRCADIPPDQEGDCLWEQCGLELFVCVGGQGQDTCETAVECMLACAKDDGMCPLECMSHSSPETVEEAYTLVVAGQSGSESMFVWMLECVGGQGTGSCADLMTCLEGCGPNGEGGDGSCYFLCMKEASPEAADLWMEAMKCGEDPCFDKLVECVGGSGDKECKDAVKCMQGCPQGDSDPSCFFDCVGSTSVQGAKDLTALMVCLQEKCGGNPENCPAALQCFALCPGFSPF
jgi:hypothetical protein